MDDRLIFEKSKSGVTGTYLAPAPLKVPKLSRDLGRSAQLPLPEVSEPDVVRHFMNLSRKNFSVDTHFYPLGSCTMKYNPKINEDLCALPGFAGLHPLVPVSHAQGILALLHELESALCALTGMARFSLVPAAGAHGELAGMMMVRAYHAQRGDTKRTVVIVPDSSHGTNPASAALYGFTIRQIASNARGRVDCAALKAALDDTCACLMLTNPNTLGLFETDIQEIAALVHAAGGLLYYDGANMNALMGIARPGDMGFDIMHVNVHKTFSTPHGGGGPGAGPVGVVKHLVDFLPTPLVDTQGSAYVLTETVPHSIGRMKAFYGNVGVLIRAYCYIRLLGAPGLTRATEDAIINANYLKKRLEGMYPVPFNDHCMHEFVASARAFNEGDLHPGDIAKRLLDFGIHAPTVSFPLIVPDALMIEPTETESRETMDAFIDAMRAIGEEARTNPEHIKTAPHTMSRSRCDEVQAARFPNVTWTQNV